MLSAILGALGAIPAILNGVSGIVKGYADLATAKVQAARDTDLAKVKSGEAVSLKQEETDAIFAGLQQAIILSDQQWWVTRWIRPGFAYLCMFHFGGTVMYYMNIISIEIEPLPSPMDYLEAGIIGTYFLLRPFEKRRMIEMPKK